MLRVSLREYGMGSGQMNVLWCKWYNTRDIIIYEWIHEDIRHVHMPPRFHNYDWSDLDDIPETSPIWYFPIWNPTPLYPYHRLCTKVPCYMHWANAVIINISFLHTYCTNEHECKHLPVIVISINAATMNLHKTVKCTITQIENKYGKFHSRQV